MLVINFKNYKHGKEALGLAKKIENNCPIAIVAVPAADIRLILEHTNLTVYAQHADDTNDERATGYVTPESIKHAGGKGVILNHSEHPLPMNVLKQ